MSESEEFAPGTELANRGARPPVAFVEEAPAGRPFLVQAEVDAEGAKKIWQSALNLIHAVVQDEGAYDTIGDKREINRTGASRLALAFGLSIEERSIDEQIPRDDKTDVRYRVRVRVGKGSRFVDGIGSCRLSEIEKSVGDVSRREHFALTRAWTRATKRAIADILGGNEAD